MNLVPNFMENTKRIFPLDIFDKKYETIKVKLGKHAIIDLRYLDVIFLAD